MVVIITTLIWVFITFITNPEKNEILLKFYKKTTPGGPGWQKIIKNEKIQKIKWSVPTGILAMIISLIMIYCCLFATGYFIYGNIGLGIILSVITVILAFILRIIWNKLQNEKKMV